MFNLVLINLTPDARQMARDAYLEQHNVGLDALRVRLEGFCEIDPIENSAGDTEIRVQVRNEKYLLRTEQRKLVLYDVNRRDLPGQLLTVAQALVELDGTAAAARRDAVEQARALTIAPFMLAPDLPAPPPVPRASKPRVVALTVAIMTLLAAIAWLMFPHGSARSVPAGFVPLPAGEREQLPASLTGVYLTGSEPGQHGIVITGPQELKLFELGATDAPRVIYASFRPGRVGEKLVLATDQPGGAVEVLADGNLRYGGETYARIP